jgi:hypothetical protein
MREASLRVRSVAQPPLLSGGDVHAINTTALPRQVNAIAFCANVAE